MSERSGLKYAEVVKSSKRKEGAEVGANGSKYHEVVSDKAENSGSQENGEWTLVESLRRRKIKSVVGNKKDEEISLKGVGIRKRYTWDLYVGNLEETVSEVQIIEYLKKQNVQVRKCVVLQAKERGTKSARITIPLEDKERALMPEFWPEFIRVRSWVIRPRWASQTYSQDINQDGRTNK